MNKRPPLTLSFLVLLTVIVASVGALLFMQRQETKALRRELELAHMNSGELERLRTANRRLLELQVPPSELAVLRADHAALPRLRLELEALSRSQPTASP